MDNSTLSLHGLTEYPLNKKIKDLTASNIPIVDVGGLITGTDVEVALQENANNIKTHLTDNVYQVAGGTSTALTLTIQGTLATGYPFTFIASANNGGAVTTINGKKLFKPNTTTSPNLITGKAYTIWYNSTGDSGNGCFFIKASAEGNATIADVLAGKIFSNDTDTGLVGTATIASLGGKRYASGTTPVVSNAVTVSNLTFQPSIIIIYCTYASTVHCRFIYHNASDASTTGGMTMAMSSVEVNTNASGGATIGNNIIGQITTSANGFIMPGVTWGGFSSFNWIAIE